MNILILSLTYPAKIISYRFDKNKIRELLQMEWWNWDEVKIREHKEFLQTKESDFMNILVAGGAGFIGSHLVDRFLEEGHRVICADKLIMGQRIRHAKQGVQAISIRRPRTERHERVHVRRPVPESAESTDKKALVDDHDRGCQQELDQGERHLVMFQHFRQIPPPHHIPHRNVHEHDKKGDGYEQSRAESGGIVVLERAGWVGGKGVPAGVSCTTRVYAGGIAFLPVFRFRVIAGIFYGFYNKVGRRGSLYAH